MPSHRWACGVAYRVHGEAMWAVHHACPFGALASVHAWERIGAALCFLGRKLLNLALLRFVDDFFAPDRYCSFRRSYGCALFWLQA